MIFGRLILGVDKFPLKAQNIESLSNLQALDGLSKCKVAMLKVRYREEKILNQRDSRQAKECLKAHRLGTHKENKSLHSRHSEATSFW